MRYLKAASLLFAIFFANAITAQRTVVLEDVRSYSAVGPVANYWRSEEMKKVFLDDLAGTLLKKQGMTLVNTGHVLFQTLSVSGNKNREFIFSDTSSNLLHLYLDIIETDVYGFLSYAGESSMDSIMRAAQSIFILQARILDAKKNGVFVEELHVGIMRGESPGVGVEYNSFTGRGILPGTPKTFAELLKKSFEILFDPKNTMEMVEMKTAPAYMADNYISGLIAGKPRILVTQRKTISEFVYDSMQMIRMGEPMYEQIMLKGKKAQVYPRKIMEAIDRSKNSTNSDFVFLRQDCRDVIRNRNYTLKLAVQIDPDFISSGPKTVFSNFLGGDVHHLLNETDTIASFSIRKNIMNTEGHKVFINKVSNGIDTSSIFVIDAKQSVWPVRYNYVIDGVIRGKSFSITFTGSNNRLKEMSVEGRKVCIADGGAAPSKFVVLDPSLSAQMLNELFFMAFNAFFE